MIQMSMPASAKIFLCNNSIFLRPEEKVLRSYLIKFDPEAKIVQISQIKRLRANRETIVANQNPFH